MPKIIDLTGEKFGKITVIEKDYDYAKRNNLKNKFTYWKCICECGNIFSTTNTQLKAGKKECGKCGRNRLTKDLTGQTFGQLYVIERDENTKYKSAYWKCRCSCGNIISVSGAHLRRNEITRCRKCVNKDSIKDISGQKFGKLTAIEPVEERGTYQEVLWRCKCDCGTTCVVSGVRLRTGVTQSCGCLCSKGEQKIKELLNKENIPFEQQKTFNNCRFPDSNFLAKFDFYVNNDFLLEFDGKQHYEYEIGNLWFNTKESFEKIKARDEYKNKWCKDNNIPLKRIPYWDLETFTFEDIFSDKYLIN